MPLLFCIIDLEKYFVINIGAIKFILIVSFIELSESSEFKLRLKIEEFDINISIFLLVCFSIFFTHILILDSLDKSILL